MKKFVLPILIFFMAGLYIFSIPEDSISTKVIFKLIPMVLILVYAYLQCRSTPNPTQWILLVGLFTCMLADGFIAYSFILGLATFLIGHLFYVVGFSRAWKFSKLRFSMILLILTYSFLMGRILVIALIEDGNNTLVFPVIAYVIVISLMAWMAIMSGNKWAIIGSLLFVISDSILSWNMFVSDIPQSTFLIMSTYYSAQFFIAHSLGSLVARTSIKEAT